MTRIATRTLKRGEARPSSLTAALDDLGISAGDYFIVARAPSSELESPGENHLGAFPGSGDESGAARDAALLNYPRSGTQRQRVLQAIIDAGERGLTSDEIAERFGMRLYSVKPRVFELRAGGWIERDGTTRPSATGAGVDVHIATPKALER